MTVITIYETERNKKGSKGGNGESGGSYHRPLIIRTTTKRHGHYAPKKGHNHYKIGGGVCWKRPWRQSNEFPIDESKGNGDTLRAKEAIIGSIFAKQRYTEHPGSGFKHEKATALPLSKNGWGFTRGLLLQSFFCKNQMAPNQQQMCHWAPSVNTATYSKRKRVGLGSNSEIS